MAAVVSCKRIAQDQPIKKLSLVALIYGFLQATPLTEELLAVDSFWERQNHFFLMCGH